MRSRRCGEAVPGRMTKTSFACAAPAGPGRQPDSRAASEPVLGVLRPLCEVLADGPGSSRGFASTDRRWANAERHSPEPLQSVERRAGLRYWPVISGDPEIGLAARRATGAAASAPAPVGALLPSHFSGNGNRRGQPEP